MVNVKIELDIFQTAEILELLRTEYKMKKQYFIEHPNEIAGLTTPESTRKLHNYILEQAHDDGELTFLTPIIMN